MLRLLIAAAGCLVLALGALGGWKLYRRATTQALHAPAEWSLERCPAPEQRAGRPVIVALGDSLTRANMSASYLAPVRARSGDRIVLLNGGRNGDRLADIAARLGPVIACQPDIITLLAGTNDVLKHGADAPGRTVPASPDWRAEAATLEAILRRLGRETDAEIAVFTLPLAGERPTDTLNRRLDGLSETLAGRARALGVTVLDLRGRQRALLDAADAERAPPCHSMADVYPTMNKVAARAQRRGADIDFDAIARARGHVLVVDCVHLSETGARPASELLGDLIDSAARSLPEPPAETRGRP